MGEATVQNAHRNIYIGPEIRFTAEPPPEGPNYLSRCFDALKRCVAKSNTFIRSLIGYGDPAIESDCSRGEISKATFSGYVFAATPLVMGILSTFAANSLAGGGFNPIICAACFGVSSYVAAADALVLQVLMFRRGVRDFRNGGVHIKVASDADRAPRRIVAFRIAWSVVFGLVVAGSIGVALNASAIDRRLTEDNLTRNAPLLRQAVADYDAQVDHARTTYNAQLGVVGRIAAAHRSNSRRAIANHRDEALGRQAQIEVQKLNENQAALDQLLASRAERLRETLINTPGYIPQSHDSVVSRFKGFAEVVHDDVFSAIPMLAIDALILGLDVFNLCLGGIGSLGRYPARFARRRLEEITEEARAAVANLKRVDPSEPDGDDPPPANPAAGGAMPPRPPQPPSPGANGAAMPRRGRGRPRKNETAQPAPNVPRAE
jgi:hypothetical protein